MTALSVNLNKIALLRNARGRDYPSVESFAKLTLDCGAAGVTIHPRPDERHARYSDVFSLKKIVDNYPHAELNIEGFPCDKFIKAVLEAAPHQCTLVPDDPNQITSDHGWDLTQENRHLNQAIKALKEKNIRVSLFMDPDVEKIKLAKQTGAERIELYTEAWAQAFNTDQQDSHLNHYAKAAKHAQDLGLEVNAGHDLNLDNLATFLQIPNIKEVSIGHALTVESLQYGFEATLNRYVEICQGA